MQHHLQELSLNPSDESSLVPGARHSDQVTGRTIRGRSAACMNGRGHSRRDSVRSRRMLYEGGGQRRSMRVRSDCFPTVSHNSFRLYFIPDFRVFFIPFPSCFSFRASKGSGVHPLVIIIIDFR